MSSQPLLRLLRSKATQVRSFTQTTPFLAAKPIRRPPPVSSFVSNPKTPQKTAPTAISKQPSLPPAVRSEYAPPTETKIQANAKRLLGNADELLLYKGPRNIALFTSSVIFGGSIFYWAATVSTGMFSNFNIPYYAKGLMLTLCAISAGLAAGVQLTPHHLVKSISLARNAEKQVVMRVKGTRFFPFLKPTVMDVVPGEMTVDSNVTTSLGGIKRWYSVPLKNVQPWTKGTLPRPGEPENNIQRFNQRMMNIGPALFSQTRKMFNREGMAYVRIGRENWKMDLEQCEILEGGSVLMDMSQEGAVRMNLMSVISRKLFAQS